MRLNQGIGACPTTGYLDFFDFAKSLDSSTYKGPKLPAVFMVSGLGSYESPFTIHYETDPYLKSLIFIDEKSKQTLRITLNCRTQKLPSFLLRQLELTPCKAQLQQIYRDCL